LSLVPLDQASQWEETLIAAGCTRGEAAEFETGRVQNFWPVAGREISERTLPQELDRDVLAISFNKGCYLGQETVARLDAMGEVQRKLCLVELHGIEEIVTPQALVRDGKEVGSLTSAAPLAADGRRLGLALMRRGSMSPDSPFMAGQVPGKVCEKGSDHLAGNS
ncbi:MAG: hypothetical protein IT423_19635, partial [Pirellulaceae bacterium]|nr:hypothetical protein [Pirellulaceae bacterium]